jgi:hypothetical protein
MEPPFLFPLQETAGAPKDDEPQRSRHRTPKTSPRLTPRLNPATLRFPHFDDPPRAGWLQAFNRSFSRTSSRTAIMASGVLSVDLTRQRRIAPHLSLEKGSGNEMTNRFLTPFG